MTRLLGAGSRALLLAVGSLTLVLGACSLAPPLKTPEIPAGQAYKELGPWTQAQPADRLPRDSWWDALWQCGARRFTEALDRR